MSLDRTAEFRMRLRDAGFPEVLCPRGVQACDYDPTTARFRLRLAHQVTADVHGALVAFALDIRGILSPQRLAQLLGVELVDGRGRRPILGVRTDERRTTLTFELPGELTSVPFEAFV